MTKTKQSEIKQVELLLNVTECTMNTIELLDSGKIELECAMAIITRMKYALDHAGSKGIKLKRRLKAFEKGNYDQCDNEKLIQYALNISEYIDPFIGDTNG